MKSLRLGTVAAVALTIAAPALAADLAIKAAPPPVAAAYNWTGFYVGINGTAVLFDTRWNSLGPNLPIGDDGAHNYTGLFGGAQVGFNYQVGSWVFGAEAQGDWGSASGSSVSLVTGTNTNSTKTDAFGLVSGRIGYALDNALFYAKGGGGAVHQKYAVDDGAGTVFGASETRWGPAAGVGFELAFSDNVSIAGEYNRVFLGSRDLTFVPSGDIYQIRQDLDVFSVHLNYRFNGR